MTDAGRSMTRLNRVAFALLGVFVVVAVATSLVALNQSGNASSKSDEVTAAFRAKVVKDQATTLKARIGSCRSSRDLRRVLQSDADLWRKIDSLITPLFIASGDARGVRVGNEMRQAIAEHNDQVETYVKVNPNCDALTPAQRAKALEPDAG